MATIVFADGTTTIGATEFFLASNSTTKVDQTNKIDLEVALDVSIMAAGDEFQITIYDKVNGGTQAPLFRCYIGGTQTELHTLPTFAVGDGWEVGIKKISGTDRSIKWTLREKNADGASAVTLAAGSLTTAKFAANAIDSTILAANCIGASQIATDAIDADSLKADATTEITAALVTGQAVLLAAVSNIAVTGAALNATTATQVVTTGTDAGGVANTANADGTYDSVSDTAGTLEFYYEFDISATTGAVAVGVDWLGYVVGLVNTIKVFARNWGGASWDQIGSIVGISGTANMSEAWELTSAHTSAGLARIRFQATGLTAATVKTDRILLGYAVVPPTVAAIQTGLATSAALTTAQTDLTTLTGRLTAARAGYLDNLSVGAVAQSSDVATLLTRLSAARAGYLDNLSAGAVATAASLTATAADITTLVGRLTAARAGYLDNLSAGAVALAATALSNVQWTNARAAFLDNLDAAISTRAASATALSTVQWTNARAALIDHLTADVATAAALATAQTAITAIKAKTDNLPASPADETLIILATNALATAIAAIPTTPALAASLVTAQADLTTLIGRLTAGRATNLDHLDADVSSRAVAATAVSNVDLTPTRSAKLDQLDAAVTTRAVAATAVSNADLTPTRAAKLDDLDATISSRAAGATALSTAVWTNALATALAALAAGSDPTVIASAVWAKVLENDGSQDITAAGMQRLIAALLAGIDPGDGADAPSFKSLNGLKTRLSGTSSAAGRLTAVVGDLTP